MTLPFYTFKFNASFVLKRSHAVLDAAIVNFKESQSNNVLYYQNLLDTEMSYFIILSYNLRLSNEIEISTFLCVNYTVQCAIKS